MALIIILALAACRSKQPEIIIEKVEEPKPEPTTITVDFYASPEMNPNRHGRASPLVVRFYILNSVTEFNHAEFFALYDEDRELLSKDMIAREELRLSPGEDETFSQVIKPEHVPGRTLYLGVLAAYRQLDQSRWRAWTSVPAEATTVVTVHLERSAISLQQQQIGKKPLPSPDNSKPKDR